MKARLQTIKTDPQGNVYLIVKCYEKWETKKQFEIHKGIDVDIQISPYSPKRSVKANAYMWKLIGLLSQKLHLTKDEIYLNLLREYGVYNTVSCKTAEKKKVIADWAKKGKGNISEVISEENGISTILQYHGTSSYSASQFSRLLDGLKQDCESVGIKTETPEEIARMLYEK